MSLFVDTSVWSLAFRRDVAAEIAEIHALREALADGRIVMTAGLVLQELLQGFTGPRARDAIVERFAALPLLRPDRDDHVEAAALRNQCRRAGVRIGTIDALLARLCLRHKLRMLTTDRDFEHIARFTALKLWRPVE